MSGTDENERTGMNDLVEISDGRSWTRVCEYRALQPGRGVAALSECGRQVAVFRDRAGELYAVDNRDPFSGAYVMSRGIVGSRGEVPTVASPMYKQVFDLRDGHCLDEEFAPDGSRAELRVWAVRRRAPRPVASQPVASQPVASQPVGAGVREP